MRYLFSAKVLRAKPTTGNQYENHTKM